MSDDSSAILLFPDTREVPLPSAVHEAACIGRLAGIDEAGRGPWAGPVVAAAVVLAERRIPKGLGDSKALTAAARARLFDALHTCAEIGVGLANEAEIERLNILGASLLAMERAARNLPRPPAAALVDGDKLPRLPCPAHALVRGDTLCPAIAAASIIAKVTRDRLMEDLARAFPAFGWERNKGYGTPEHAAALAAHGPTPHHRRGFKPVAEAIAKLAG